MKLIAKWFLSSVCLAFTGCGEAKTGVIETNPEGVQQVQADQDRMLKEMEEVVNP